MMENDLLISLLSGLCGAVLTIVVSECIKYWKNRNERRALFQAVASECRYNLSILDEITNGTNRGGSFKRMSVEFFKTIRQQSVAYALRKKFLLELSRVIVDLELFNLEVDTVYKGNMDKFIFVGTVGNDAISMVKDRATPNISAIVNAASEGVKASLKSIMEIAQNELDEEDDAED